MRTDVHAHYVPPAALTAAELERDRYGVAVLRVAEGPRVSFAGGPLLRPAVASLLRLADRPAWDHCLVSVWPELWGHRLLPAQGEAWARLCNDALAADLRGRPGWLGCAQVPLQAPAAAAAEVRRAVSELNFRAVMVPGAICGQPLDAMELAPFWAAVAELEIPVYIHPADPPGAERLDRHGLRLLAGEPYEVTLAALDLILGGVCARYPSLRLILAHGGGYLPWAWGRVVRGYQVSSSARDGLIQEPAEHLGQFWYDSLVHDPAALSYLVRWAGADRVLLGTDAPMALTEPAPEQMLAAADLAPEAAAAILGGNAARLFRI